MTAKKETLKGNGNLRPWKKGQSGNPGGRRKVSPEEKKLLSLTRVEVARLLNMVCEMTVDEMHAKFCDDSAMAIEKLFVKTITDALQFSGDAVKAADFILNRTIGKPKEELMLDASLEITSGDRQKIDEAKKMLQTMPNERDKK